MILGLCSSFAVVPALSLVNGGSGATRRLAKTVHQPGGTAEPSVSPGPEGLAALLLSDAALAAASSDGEHLQSLAAAAGAASVGAAVPDSGGATKGPVASGGPPPASSPRATSATPLTPASPANPAPLAAPAAPATPVTPAPRSAAAPASGPVASAAPAAPTTGSRNAAPQHHSMTAQAQQQGVASWLDTIPTGTCANNDAPMGTTITVTNGAGVSVTCKVISRGPFGPGRVVDLAKLTFAALGPVSQGLVGVAVSW